MKMMDGTFEMKFQGRICRCPMSGVREGAHVEVAIATPFGLRRVVAELGADYQVRVAHTFAFDYETGDMERFELEIAGGGGPNFTVYQGTVSGGGLEGTWVLNSRPVDAPEEEDEADEAFQIGSMVPMEVTPAPSGDPES